MRTALLRSDPSHPPRNRGIVLEKTMRHCYNIPWCWIPWGLLASIAGVGCSASSSNPDTSTQPDASHAADSSEANDGSQARQDAGKDSDAMGADGGKEAAIADDSGRDGAPVLSGVHIGQDGRFFVDGVPFFPVGAYVVSWSLTTTAILNDLQQIKAAGFNTAHLGLSNDDLMILDNAQQLGLKIIVEGADSDQVTRIKSHPALLAWNIQDEPDINGVSATDVQTKQDSLKAFDVDHPTLVVVTDPTSYATYASIPDVFGIDPYINQYSGNPISYVGDCTASALGLRDSLLVVAHAFSEGGRFLLPSVPQERSIVYQALVNGGRSLLFFAFDAPPSDNWYMPNNPEFFDGVKTLLAELNIVGPVLATADTRQSLAVSTAGVRATYIVSGAKKYVMTVSSLDQTVVQVQFVLGEAATSAHELFENRTIPISGQTFADDLVAYGSHVYDIE